MRSLLKTRSLVLALLVFSISAVGDVPPDPGYTNVSADLIIESTADLSGYRFFLESPMRVEEVKIASGSPTVISAAGRAGAAKFGKLIAVPISDITISGELTPSLLEDLIRRKSFANARELFSHNFQTSVSVVEKPLWKPPVYRLSLENGAVTAMKVSSSTGSSLLMYAIPVVVFGVLITVGIAIIGLWLFRRSRKKV
ncbi:MAG: hypothetical protein ABL984_17365 [Pyrinomonadaceae bacterium]